MRETSDRKALRLLAAGAVRIVSADRSSAVAVVRGDGGRHVVRILRGRGRCDCAAAEHGSRCSHLVAVELVALAALSPARGRPEAGGGGGGPPGEGIGRERAAGAAVGAPR